MRIEEYGGILASPKVPQEQKLKAIRKLEKAKQYGLLPKFCSRVQITPPTPLGNKKYGHVSIFLDGNEDHRLFDIRHIFLEIEIELTETFQFVARLKGCDKEYQYNQYDEYRKVKQGIKQLKQKIKNEIDKEITNVKEVPYSIPQHLYELMKKRYPETVILDCYDVKVNIDLQRHVDESEIKRDI